jgi:hypothetical protein
MINTAQLQIPKEAYQYDKGGVISEHHPTKR